MTSDLEVELLSLGHVILVGGLHAGLQGLRLLGAGFQLGAQTGLQRRHFGLLCIELLC